MSLLDRLQQALGIVRVSDGTNSMSVNTDGSINIKGTSSSVDGAPANTAVTSTASVVLAANASRVELIIVNTDVVPVYICLGQTPTGSAYHIALAPCTVAHDGTGGSFVSDVWKGAVSAIVASTSGHVSVTELT